MVAVRAVVVTRSGGPEVLALEEGPEPKPGAREVCIDVAAAGVNYIDIYQRSGRYAVEPPFVAGSEGAGTVSAVGPEVESVAVGDRVAWLMVPGAGYAEQVVVPAERCVPVPDDIDLRSAAAAMLQGVTAEYLTSSTYPVAGGDDRLQVDPPGRRTPWVELDEDGGTTPDDLRRVRFVVTGTGSLADLAVTLEEMAGVLAVTVDDANADVE